MSSGDLNPEEAAREFAAVKRAFEKRIAPLEAKRETQRARTSARKATYHRKRRNA